ncbi:MAG TPA: M20 family metallopeptidase [Afifellaceae bacterium]|nr:M20 family metallopeptidase [Afifellaceae bacterium]
MARNDALARAVAMFDDGRFEALLARRVALRTESQEPGREEEVRRYLEEELRPDLEGTGATVEIWSNPSPGAPPFLYAERHEGANLPTVLVYGHGDVIRGLDDGWREGLSPWRLTKEGERWYGRGTADNKGQHTINLLAVQAVLAERGRLGFNLKLLVEMAEEIGSPGLHELCSGRRDRLSADLLIASDGPRVAPERPTVFLGSRGALNFDIAVELREGAHHSGNWGGLIANGATLLVHALSELVDERGAIRLADLRPDGIPDSVRQALADCAVEGGEDGPAIDPDWGEPGLSPAERVYAWPTLEVLSLHSGRPENPVNAVPGSARAHCQLRTVVGMDPDAVVPAIETHLAARGLTRVRVTRSERSFFRATRLDPDHPYVRWAVRSLEATTGKKPAILPNLGGSLPNDAFAEILALPTVWVPHSYAGCSQHAPNEHLLAPLAREALAIMAGLFWDLGNGLPPASPSVGA